MNEKDTKEEIERSLRSQVKGLFGRGAASEKDRKLIEKWIGKFAQMCQEDFSDESD